MPKDKCESLLESNGRRERAITAEQTRIAAREDRCLRGSLRGQQSLRQVSVCENTACARPRALLHLEACWKNRRSMCCRALCGYGHGTWMLQDDRTTFILQQKSLLHEKCKVKPRGGESENVPNRSKVKVFIQCV